MSDTDAQRGPSLPDSPAAKGAWQIVATLQRSGFTAYMAGGCVRDLLLGRTPKDYDIATNASPDTVMSLFPGSDAVGRAFGVVLVSHGDFHFEVATFRSDCDYRDGRHPTSVVFSSPREDAERRDFTINAMFFDPATHEVHDFIGGQSDLARHVIRCVGDPVKRFTEDHLRLLRAVRFAGTLSFQIDQVTADAICRLADKVSLVSPERVRDELTRMLTESPLPGDTLRLLHQLGLLRQIMPEVSAMIGQAQPPEFHPEGDVFEHTVLMLNGMPPQPDPILAFAVLLHDVGKPPVVTQDNGRLRFNCHAEAGAAIAERIMRRLRFSARDTEAVAECVRHHMQFRDVVNMKRATLRRLMGRPTFLTELELHRLDCLSSHRMLGNYEYLQEALKQFSEESPLPPRWITGADLIALGVSPGPNMGAILREAYDAQLGGKFPSREATLEWLREHLSRESGGNALR